MTDNTESPKARTVLKPARDAAIVEVVKAEMARRSGAAPGINITLKSSLPDTPANRVAVLATTLGTVMADAICVAMLNGGDGPAESNSLRNQVSAHMHNKLFDVMAHEETSPQLRQLWHEQWAAEGKRQQQERQQQANDA